MGLFPYRFKLGKAAPTFEEAQARYGDVSGDLGAALRQLHYGPFFLKMGRNVHIDEGCRFTHPERIVLEDDAQLNVGALVYGSGGVWIGRHARIGPRCFIHSANHDISADGQAFFERGYVEDAVVIGDLSSISANVSILPGVHLEAGCFVACGAVVTKGRYDEGSKLFGSPARKAPKEECSKPINPAPDMVILVPSAGHWRDLARHLLTPLGFPQVQVVTDAEPLPGSAHSVLVIGPSDWVPQVKPGPVVWRVSEGDVATKRNDLPNYRPLTVVNAGGIGLSRNIESEIDQAAYWLFTRLQKGSAPLGLREFREWLTTLRILKLDFSRPDRLLETILASLLRRHPSRLSILSEPPASMDGLDQWLRNQAYHIEMVERLIKEKFKSFLSRRLSLSYQDAVSDPERLVRRVQDGLISVDEFAPFFMKMVSSSPTGLRMVGFGLCAIFLQDDEGLDLIKTSLREEEWRVPGVSVPRSVKNGSGLCYSPLVLAWLVKNAIKQCPGFELRDGVGRDIDCGQLLTWLQFADKGFIDRQQKRVSRSLVDNWLALHSAPCQQGTRFQITDGCYTTSTHALEQLWLEVFRGMQEEAGRCLIRLHPWPAGYKAAFSLRYDVDRPVSAKTISEIVDLQAMYANAACASWYYFEGHPDRTRQRPQLSRHWQEVGLHIETVKNAREGFGVTHHSSPKAEYWRGDDTNRSLNQSGVSYCEFLATRLTTPRPAWIADGQDAYLGNTWTIPLHFPLEGSTNEADLGYFDRLLDVFHTVLESGGHAIVGSHPDLDQSIIRRLLEREDTAEIWFASVCRVVERCRDVMFPGNVIALSGDNSIALLSAKHIADLLIEIWHPEADSPQTAVLQLVGGQPREGFVEKRKPELPSTRIV